MTYYDKICDFQNLLKAHRVARLGKRCEKAVVEFEMRLSENLSSISEALRNHTYKMAGYYGFMVHDPKDRLINALHYRDRVVQHCLCDEVLAPVLDRLLIYDNAACRPGKGTHFALDRLSGFLSDFFRAGAGKEGYFLKCDIKKFFDNIDHEVLRRKLERVFDDEELLALLFQIIDSYEKTPGKGLPLGNQTSQWFAIYYLDSFDRIVKERLGVKYYSRYMDDCVMISGDKDYLRRCLDACEKHLSGVLKLEFNSKTQICPLKNGVNYLGFRFCLTDSGRVVRRLRKQTKLKFARRLKLMKRQFLNGELSLDEIRQVVVSYIAHIGHGDTRGLLGERLRCAVFHR